MVDEVKLCKKCDEEWPADLEFFFSDPNTRSGLFYCCKACYYEKLAPDRRRQAPAIDGPHATDSLAPFLRLIATQLEPSA